MGKFGSKEDHHLIVEYHLERYGKYARETAKRTFTMGKDRQQMSS